MNTFCVIAAFFALVAAASAQNDVSGRFFGCESGTKNTVDHDFNVYAKQYPNSKHVFYLLQLTVRKPTTSYSIDICFDAPQCITAAWNVHLYPIASNVGAYCWNFVSDRDYALVDGNTVAIRFETWAATPVRVSSVTLHGNGVINVERIPRYTPQSPADHCTACDGDYFPAAGSCGHYYQCSNGVPYLMPCASGLYFNTAKDVCDYPANAGCYKDGMKGKRRVQCRGSDGNCVSGADIYFTTRNIGACTHGNPPKSP